MAKLGSSFRLHGSRPRNPRDVSPFSSPFGVNRSVAQRGRGRDSDAAQTTRERADSKRERDSNNGHSFSPLSSLLVHLSLGEDYARGNAREDERHRADWNDEIPRAGEESDARENVNDSNPNANPSRNPNLESALENHTSAPPREDLNVNGRSRPDEDSVSPPATPLMKEDVPPSQPTSSNSW